MKLHTSLLLSLTCILASTQLLAKVSAQNSNVTTTQISKEKVARSLSPVGLRKTSYENRIGKKAALTAGFGFEMSEFSQFLNTDLILDADSLLSFRVAYARDEYDRYDTSFDKDTQLVTSIQFKQFVANSFYLKGGLYYRDLKEESSRKYIFTRNTGIYRLRDAGLTFNIGNQWNFDKFVIGCDWFGVTNALKTIKQNGNSNDFFSSDENKTSFNLLAFYMGMTF